LLETYSSRGIRFYAPDIAFEAAGKYLPSLLRQKGKSDLDVAAAHRYLERLAEPVDRESYSIVEDEARLRLSQ
jgi:hypothetical protein